MDKLYSRHSLIYKAVFCLMLSPLYAIFFLIFNIEDGFLHIIVTLIPIGCLYTIPFWISVVFIKKHRVKQLGKYILLDAGVCTVPAIFGILVLEIVTAVINGSTAADGFATVIFSIVFLAISIVFWLFYLIFSKIR